MFSVVKNYILENNSKDWDAQTVNGLASCIIDNAKKYNVSMPIVEQINRVLFENVPATEAIKNLFNREKCSEYSGLEWS